MLCLEPNWTLTSGSTGDIFSPDELTPTSGHGICLPYEALHTTDEPIMGVRGLVEYDGLYLWGLRSALVGSFQGHWELAPSGALPSADFRSQLAQELEEETGITQIASITPLAIIGEGRIRDLFCRIELSSAPIIRRGPEYSELRWSLEPPGNPVVPYQKPIPKVAATLGR